MSRIAALKLYWPGLLVAGLVAGSAQFLSEHYGAPALLMGLLLGMALHFLGEEGPCRPGIEVAGRQVLRFGVALLGARISVEMVAELGSGLALLVVGAVAATFAAGVALARATGRDWGFGALTGGSVAICGVSAALALAAVLPKREEGERDLIFTVIGVTVLSTLAMIVYPMIGTALGLGERQMGVFLGGTIHDVAQVVGAGFSISDAAGETATVVKLLRVALLGPLVIALAIVLRQPAEPGKKRPPVVPGFVAAFLALAALNSLGLVPASLVPFLATASRVALLVAIAAVGMKTSLRRMTTLPVSAFAIIVGETLFLGLFVLAGIEILGPR